MGIKLEQYGFRIERTAKRIRQFMQRRLNEVESGITIDQWLILDVLLQHDGMSQYEIAEKTYKDAPTVTRIIDLLCKKGLTKRVMDEEDRRRFKIFLTAEGKEKTQYLLPIVMEMRENGWKDLEDDDYYTLLKILDRVFSNFE